MTRSKNEYAPEQRLKQLGFSDEDLKRISAYGWTADYAVAEVERLLYTGLTTEAYARETFAEAYPEIFEGSLTVVDEKQPTLKYDKSDKLKCEITNFVEIMRHDERYSGIKYNEMSGRAEIHSVKDGKLTIAPWTDADEARSMMYIESQYGLYSKDKHSAALRVLFEDRAYNPIIDIVDGIKWDGEPRCRHFLSKWGKVEDSAYTREVSRLIFAGGIHRLYEPGCKFEDIPILIGDQGCGKSTLVRYLAINDDYFGELKIMEGQAAIEKRELQREIAALQDEKQTYKLGNMMTQANAPLAAAINALQSDVDGIKCRLPKTEVIPATPDYVQVNRSINIPYGPYCGYGAFGDRR